MLFQTLYFRLLFVFSLCVLFGCHSRQQETAEVGKALGPVLEENSRQEPGDSSAFVENDTLDPVNTPSLIRRSAGLSLDSLYPDNATGVVYLDQATDDSLKLTVRMHQYNSSFAQRLLDSIRDQQPGFDYTQTIEFPTSPVTITLIRDTGMPAQIVSPPITKFEFWCENDGPLQVHPTYHIAVPQDRFQEFTTPWNTDTLGNIVAFGLIRYAPTGLRAISPTISEGEARKVVGVSAKKISGPETSLSGDIFSLSAIEDEAGGANYCIYLYAGGMRQWEIACCGP